MGSVVLLLFLTALPILCQADLSTAPITSTWIPNISRRMVTFAESQTGALQLVKEYDKKLNFTEIQIDGQAQLRLMTQTAGDRLKMCREILDRNKAEIEASHAQGPTGGAPASDCCDNLGQLEYDPMFLQQIVNDSCATYIAGNATTNTVRPPVYDTMKSNLQQMSGVIWQYYGAKQGEYHQFPKNDRSCGGNDHRFRNWYANAASPKKKNVVIVMDVSGSMRDDGRLDLAKDAALTVLDTLTPRDWGGVVSFSARAEAPDGCLGETLGEANPTNIGIMRDFINQRVPETITFYSEGFKKAFDMFKEAKDRKPEQFEDCYNIIIFLTDGQPTDTYFSLDDITKGQDLMDRSVHIFTYGLGTNLQFASSGWAPDPNNPWVKLPVLDFLATIADQNNRQIPGAVEWTNRYCTQGLYGSCFSPNRDPQGVGPWGRTEYIDDRSADKLKTIMGSYYDFFPFSSDPEPTYSVPTNDQHLGLVITAALPTIDTTGTFFGVTGVDISMDVVFHEVANFNIGKYSYAFLVDREDGRVLIHRNLPKPMEWLSQPTFLSLESMESALRSREITKILNGNTGDYFTRVKVPIARGNAQFDGAVTIEKEATFYYEPIPDTKYSVVLCFFVDDETIAIPNPVIPDNTTDELYHRLDLLYMNNATGDTEVCTLYDEYATPDESTVKFPPEAFADTIHYLNTLETFDDVVDIDTFISDFTGAVANPGLIDGIRTDVILSAEIEEYWRENGKKSVWRYFGTENGVFRIFPGVIADKRYNPTRQTWYQRALSRQEDYTFSRPVPSPFGGGNMVTISRVIFHTKTEEVLGVIAADITELYYYSMLFTEVPECLSDEYDCFLLDDSGYFMESLDNTTIYYLSTFNNNTQNMEHDHLTHRFPWLAKELIIRGEYLRSEWCNNYATQNSQLFYDTTGFTGLEVTTGPPCYQFALYPINATNTFILTLHNRHTYNCNDRPITVGGNQNCSCNDICQTCSKDQLQVCQCPCVCDWNYESCTNEILRLLSDIPCPPPPEDLTGRRPGPPYPPGPEVENCEERCSAQSDNITCEALPHCVWCEEMDFPVCTEICLTNEKIPVSVFFPCVNLTSLSRDEQEELKENFYLKVTQLLPNVKQEAIHFPEHVTENTIEFILQGEMSSPPPAESISLLRQQTNWRQNFTVGPHRDPHMFRSADSLDYTDMVITMYFNGVDFENLVSQHSVSENSLHPALETALANAGISAQYVTSSRILQRGQDYLQFSISKQVDSSDNLMLEVAKLVTAHNNGGIVLNLKPGWPVSVGVHYEGTFDSICSLLKMPTDSTSTAPTPTTMVISTTNTQVPTIVVKPFSFDCLAQPAGMYPDPEDCTMFYQCQMGSPVALHMPCAPGTVFDWDLLVCNHDASCANNPYIAVAAAVGVTADPSSVESGATTCTNDYMELALPAHQLSHVVTSGLHWDPDPSCLATFNGTHYILRTGLYQCGTKVTFDTKYVIFSNNVSLLFTHDGVITRDPDVLIRSICKYERTEAVMSQFLPIPGGLESVDVGFGKLFIRLDLFLTQSYLTPYTTPDYPVHKHLRDRVYLQLQVQGHTQQLSVIAIKCEATSGQNASLQYPLILGGCASDNTLQFHSVPDPAAQRFSLEAFRFVQEVTTVNIRCEVEVCDAADAGSRCAQGCRTNRHHKRALRNQDDMKNRYVISRGPIIFSRDSQHEDGVKNIGLVVGGSVVMITLAAVLLAVKVRRSKQVHPGYQQLVNLEAD